ncbi:MAG TPA: enoyl-CoA hydratase-related protein [Terriglobales bacterium]|nr:enoyl-CoA hydratase-related protein [Terriglobales bacterium]
MSASGSQEFRHLRLERRGPVAVLIVSRPEKLNALNRETLEEIDRAVSAFTADEARGALIVTGAGEKSFVAGADIEELAGLSPREAEATSRFGQGVMDRIERCGKPVLAAVNGYALGGGCELALACHVRIASDNAAFGLPEVGLGLIPGYGGTQRLPRLIGPGRALELIATGRRLRAEEALAIGLVSRVVPSSRLLDEAEQLALAILANGPLAVAAALEAVRRGSELPLDAGLRLESALFGMVSSSEDAREGLRAFLEKRPARFQRR